MTQAESADHPLSPQRRGEGKGERPFPRRKAPHPNPLPGVAGRGSAVVLILLLAAPAQAFDIVKREDLSLEGSAFLKSFGAGLGTNPGFADELDAFQKLLDDTRALLPPDQQGQLPGNVTLPRGAAFGFETVRLQAHLAYGDWLQAEAAWQVTGSLASHPQFSNGASLSGFVPTGDSGGAQRRLIDFNPVLATSGTLLLQHNLDRLFVKFTTRVFDLTIGRQVLSWGTGHLWNPTDLLSPFAPTTVDKEVRRGVDAVRASIPIAETTQLELLWLPQKVAADNGGAARLQANLAGYDFSISAAKYVRDLVFGLDFAGDLGPLGLHGEGAYTVALDGLGDPKTAVHVGENFLRAVVGVDWKPTDKFVLMLEYHFNGYGATSPSGYLEKLTSARVQRGEVFGAGRHYLGLVAAWQVSELFSVQGLLLGNLTDPSAMFVPSLEWWFEQNVIVRAGAFIPIGAWPDAAPMRALTPADVLAQSDAFLGATRTMGVKSEYGLGGFGGFVQVGLYIP